MVFRGSEWVLNDWINNFKQPFGKSEQYDQAAYIAGELSKIIKRLGSILIFVGHSLGGGLASLAAKVTGDAAITFNAAGLSEETKKRHKVNGKRVKIDAYVVEGEIVDYYQKKLSLRADTDGPIKLLKSRNASYVEKIAIEFGDLLPPLPLPGPLTPIATAERIVRTQKHSISEVIKLLKENCQ